MNDSNIIDRLRQLEDDLEGTQREAVHDAIERLLAMAEQLGVFKRCMASNFRRKSEKVDPGQLTLDLLGFVAEHRAVDDSQSQDDKKKETEKPAKPKRRKRRSGVQLLPVEEVVVPLDPSDKVCACGRELNSIGYDVRRQIIYTPARLHMLEEHLEKCACGVCKDGVKAAEGTAKPIEGGLASSTLLAHIAVSKCVDAIPVERTGRILAREGADLASSTLHEWFSFTAKQAGLIAGIAHAQLLASKLISLDDTTLLTKKHDERDGTQRGRLWMFIGDVNRVALCRFTPDWKGSHPRAVLDGFGGTVQLDGYGGLNPMFKANDNLRRVGCNDHCRRHFVQALRDGDNRAAPIVDIYQRLYEVEAFATANNLEPDMRLQLRQRRALPLWRNLTQAIEALQGSVTRKSPLGKGVTYWRKQNTFLAAYLSDGFVPISNIHVEQLIRTVALFRKNSLFVGNTEAGQRYADLMTLMVNCVLCGANPYEYLSDVLNRLATGWPARRVDELMPQAWLGAKKSSQQPVAA